MKKSYIKVVVALLLLLVMIVYCFPRSLDHIIQDNSRITIVYHDESYVNGRCSLATSTYEITDESEYCLQIVDLCSKYQYHRTLLTLFQTNSMTYQTRELDYSFTIFVHRKNKLSTITLCGDGRILMDGHMYRMDFNGRKQQTAFMKELKSFLLQNEELLQQREEDHPSFKN